MDIGTAKPSQAEREAIKHHMIDLLTPDQEFNAGLFAQQARDVIADLDLIGKIPIICGGTGFYVKALLDGLFESDEISPEIRKNVADLERTKGTQHIHQILQNIDPKSAERIHPNDSYRLKRAFEVWVATGKSIGEHWEEQEKQTPTYDVYRVMMTYERDKLYERINQRVDKMLRDGLINEINSLIERGYTELDPGMNSVGYKEFLPYVIHSRPFLPCVEEAKQNTRHYAKRQSTWYRRIKSNATISLDKFDPNFLLDEITNYFESRGNALD